MICVHIYIHLIIIHHASSFVVHNSYYYIIIIIIIIIVTYIHDLHTYKQVRGIVQEYMGNVEEGGEGHEKEILEHLVKFVEAQGLLRRGGYVCR